MNFSLKLLFSNDALSRHMGANPQTTFRRLYSSFSLFGTALQKAREISLTIFEARFTKSIEKILKAPVFCEQKIFKAR